MEEIQAPEYFLCPISLQIMRDPVTAITGITYERESIEGWLIFDGNTGVCPVTNQPLSKDSDLTPNHTLRRLIQSWSICNVGVDRIPNPTGSITDDDVLKLLHDLSVPRLLLTTLQEIETKASDSESNRRWMVRAGVGIRMASLLVSAHRKHRFDTVVEQVLRILNVLKAWSTDFDSYHRSSLSVNYDLIECLMWVMKHPSSSRESKSHAILVLKSMFHGMEDNPNGILERLKADLFEAVVQVLHTRINTQITKAALEVLLVACPWGSNKTKLVAAGAVAEIIEIELATPDKRTSELNLAILELLCSCADGREKFLDHAAGIAMVTKRILRVSPAADEKAVGILTAVCNFSRKSEILQEMLRVGGVTKLCMVLQANSEKCVKEKARWVLRLHNDVWKDSSCVAVYLLTRYPRH